MTPRKGRERLDWGYLAFAALAVLSGVLAGWWGQPLIAGNEGATGVIVTVFSILAGFLIAIMTLLGDQSILPGSWRMASCDRDRIKGMLIRQKWLFYWYLVTLSLIFAASLIRSHYPCATEVLERVYFGLAVSAFVLSFGLPGTLMRVQSERMDAVVKARRERASTLDRN
jgi:hypothetical protein